VATVTTVGDTVVLHAGRWVRLPDTDYEIYMHGKSGALHVQRNGGPWGGWSLPPAVYVRRVTTPDRR